VAWFSRNKSEQRDPPRASAAAEADPEDVELPLRPLIERPGDDEWARLSRGRAALEKAGLDPSDLEALGAAYDTALTTWQAARKGEREDEREIVERFAIGIGEHLHRSTDLSWSRARTTSSWCRPTSSRPAG
jgi:hypothetical protein